jgi:hypothetical protein
MSVDPTAMNMGATATAAAPAATLSTSVASPSLKASQASRMRERRAMPVKFPAQRVVTANSHRLKVLVTT